MKANHRRSVLWYQSSNRRWSILMMAIVAVVIFCSQIRADEIKLKGKFYWVRDVTVDGIADGRIVYERRGSEFTKPLDQVEQFRLDPYPEVAVYWESVSAGKTAEARQAVTRLAKHAREKWLKHWATARTIAIDDKSAKPIEAVEGFLWLVRAKANPTFLADPPVLSLWRASATAKQDIRQRLERGLASATKGPAQDGIRRMLKALEREELAAADAGRNDDSTSSKVLLPKAMDQHDPITKLLKQGKWQEALESARTRLEAEQRHMSMRLYQLGVAQLHQADKSGDIRQYKDAGLSFMRVAIYFPGSRYTGPALLEAGYVHQKIGRPELADRLWAKAALAIDPEVEPALNQRLKEVIAEANRSHPKHTTTFKKPVNSN